MCISLYVPAASIRIEYASETVWLERITGVPKIVADILLKNNSGKDISEVSCIVPQRLYNPDGTVPLSRLAEDITEDLMNGRSEYSKGMTYKRREHNNSTWLDLTLPNPLDATKDLPYSGVFLGGNCVQTYPSDADQRVVMNYCMFGVFTVRLGTAMAPGEMRWFRWKINPLTGPQEQRSWAMQCWHYITNNISLSYHVSGPGKVPKDVADNLAALRHTNLTSPDTPEDQRGAISTKIDDLWNRLIEKGVCHKDTRVEIGDWRTRFFRWPMEPFVTGENEGAVRIVGPQPNFVKRVIKAPYQTAYYEWATGPMQLGPAVPIADHGAFTIRFATRYIPVIHRLVPMATLIAFLLAVLSLLWQIKGW